MRGHKCKDLFLVSYNFNKRVHTHFVHLIFKRQQTIGLSPLNQGKTFDFNVLGRSESAIQTTLPLHSCELDILELRVRRRVEKTVGGGRGQVGRK
jgi:hypothetical protein